MCQAGRPDAAGVGAAQQVKLTGPRERARDQLPARQVTRVMDLHAREPLESRGCNIVIVADAHNGGVGIKPAEDGISYRYGVLHGRV